MTKTISKKIVICIMIALFILASTLLSGCYDTAGLWMWLQVADTEWTINRIIFTDTPEKYIQGKEIRSLEDLTADEDFKIEDYVPLDGITAVSESATTNIVDFVINSSLEGTRGQYGYSGDGAVHTMRTDGTYKKYLLLDCSRIFSGLKAYYIAGGEGKCSADPNCTSFIYDEIDHNVCNNHGYTLYFQGDGTFEQSTESWMHFVWEYSNPNQTLNCSFNELVLDGFDFGVYYDFISNYDYLANHYPNYQSIHDPNNFRNMFSDLPVSKITISNIKGLAGRVNDMSGMFENCVNLKSIEFGNLFDGVQPTNISRMFYNCPRLTNIDLSGLDTSKVTDMSEMFALLEPMTNDQRTKMINDFINNDIVPQMVDEFDKTKQYDLESFTEAYNETTNEPMTKEQLLFIGVTQMGAKIPLTYDEFCLGAQGITFSDLVQAINENPADFDFDPKEDGSQYTEKEIMKFLDDAVAASGITLITEEDLYIDVNAPVIMLEVPSGKLTLGGNDSKFVINANVDTENMFVLNYNFGIIVTPKSIADDVQIQLISDYTDGVESRMTTISATNANQAIYYHVEDYNYEHLIKENEITPPATITIPPTNNSGGLGNTLKTALIMIGGAVVVIMGTVLVTIVAKRKR